MDPLALLRPEGCAQRLFAHPVRALGIDLGTTNSTIAEIIWQPSGPEPKVRCLEVDQETLSGTRASKWACFSTTFNDPLPLFGKLLPLEKSRQLSVRRADQADAPKAPPPLAPATPNNNLDCL